MESKAQKKRNRRNKNKKAAEEPATAVEKQGSNEESKWEQVDLNTPTPVEEGNQQAVALNTQHDGFMDQALEATNTSGANEYNPFDQVEEDDMIRAPQTNDGSFHHVPTSDELL